MTSTFAKGFRLRARGVGYAVVPAQYLPALSAISEHLLLATDPVPQLGALEALRHLDEVDSLCALYRKRRDYAEERLSGVATVRPIRPSGGFYLTVDVSGLLRPGESDRSLARAILLATRVAAVPGSDFWLPGTLRLSFAASRFDVAVDRLARHFAEVGGCVPGEVARPVALA